MYKYYLPFAERLKRYLEKWREMAGYEAKYEGLQELILRDQYCLTCEQSMQVFLKEKGKLSLKDMTKESMYFIEAHGYKHKKKTNGSNSKASNIKPNGSNESTKISLSQQQMTGSYKLCMLIDGVVKGYPLLLST